MDRIGIVSNDPRLKSDLQKWFEDIEGEYLFVALGSPPDAPPEVELAEATTTDPPGPFKLVIFDSNFGQPLSKIRDEANLPNVPWLAIGLEEHARNPHVPLINGADDLILMPLDRSVFLQKAEYLLAGSETITPSFLYLAKADLPIELAKGVRVTHLSETGCTILAPRPLAQGLEGTLISKIFGAGPFERVEVRAVQSNPVFDSSVAIAGQSAGPCYEVNLRFFGLRQKQLAEIRKWLSAQQSHGFPEITRSDKDPQAILHVAMISPQPALSSQLKSSLEKLAKIEVEEFGGLKRFQVEIQKRVVREKPTEPIGPLSSLLWTKAFIGPKTPDQHIPPLPHPTQTVFMRVPTENVPGAFERSSPQLKPADHIFGTTWEAWSREAANLTKTFSEEDRETFDEAVQWSIANSSLSHHPESEVRCECAISETIKMHASLRISLAEPPTPSKSALIKIHIEDVTESEMASNLANGPKMYEAILVDASVLSADVRAKLVGVGQWLETFNVRSSFGNRPPIVVFNAKEDRVDPNEFRGTPVRQLVYDFNDRRFQAELFISLSRPELWTAPQASIEGLKVDQKAFLARPAKASGVSEVSIMIDDRVPLKKGTELLILSPVWSQAPEGLWARLRSASSKDDHFENEFIFFGVSDLVQKEIRKFAREDYIKKKAQGQGG